MTEKNIFAYKVFLSLNISDFNLFLMWQLHPVPPTLPPEKSHPFLSQQHPYKSWGHVKPPFWKIWLEAQPPPAAPPPTAERGVHTMFTVSL